MPASTEPTPGRAVRESLLAWLYERRSASSPAFLTDFMSDSRATHGDQDLTWDDIGSAAAVLAQQGLASTDGVDEARWPIMALITPAGIAHVEDGPASLSGTNALTVHGDVIDSQVQQGTLESEQQGGGAGREQSS